MRAPVIAICIAAGITPGGIAFAQSDSEIRRAMVLQSIATYPGNCPCPYSIMRNGRMCGSKSAYSRPGGRAPLCYPHDISDAMVDEHRKRSGK